MSQLTEKRHKPVHLEPLLFNTFNIIFLLLLCVVMLYPILNTLALSFNEGYDAVKGGIRLWPRVFSAKAYSDVLSRDAIYIGAFISATKTIVAVVTNLFFTMMLAYSLSRREYILSRPITLFFVITMYFNAGLIPNFLLIKDLGLIPSFTVYWIPHVISAFNPIVMRTYIRSIPESLVESSRIDGAGEFRILFRIVFPLCLPTLATIALFVAVGSWNTWFDTMLYNTSNPSLTTLQYELKRMLDTAFTGDPTQINTGEGQVVPLTIRAAATVVTAIPILIVYPFLQRYFVTGLTVGSVKE